MPSEFFFFLVVVKDTAGEGGDGTSGNNRSNDGEDGSASESVESLRGHMSTNPLECSKKLQ